MIKQRLKIIFVVVWIAAMLILAIPNFSFTLGDRTFNINYADRLAEKVGSTLGNFERSSGTFESREVRANLTFSENDLSDQEKRTILEDYHKIINNRAKTANLYDVSITSKIYPDSGAYSLVFTYPEYYSDPIKYTSWLTSKGEFSFITADAENPVPLSLTGYDITGSINLDYLDTVGSHIVFRFKNEQIPLLQQAFQSTQGSYFLMNIDSIPQYFILQYDQFINTNEDLVRALPTQAVSISNTKERNDFLNITRTYFLNNSLENSFTVLQDSNVIKPIFKNSSTLFTAEMFIIGAMLLGIFLYIKFRRFGIVKYTLIQLSFVLTFVAALKILSSTLSISFIVGFVLIYFIINTLSYYLLMQQDSEENIDESLRLVRDLSIFGFLLLTIVYRLVPNLNIFTDAVGVILIGLIVLAFMSILHFKFIFEIFDKPVKLKNLKLPKLRSK